MLSYLYCQGDTLSLLPSYTIIKRRVAWLIGKWVSEECCPASHSRIWEILARLISPEVETVVRLTAAAALRDCVDVRLSTYIVFIMITFINDQSVGFEPNSFAPFLASTVPQLMRLMGDADTLESKRKVDGCLNIIIEQSGALVSLFR
jgi:hypothetical protein